MDRNMKIIDLYVDVVDCKSVATNRGDHFFYQRIMIF